jgi:hypothetical protein
MTVTVSDPNQWTFRFRIGVGERLLPMLLDLVEKVWLY